MFLSDIASTTPLQWAIIIGIGLIMGWLIGTSKKKNNSKQVIFLNPEEFRANMRKGQLIDIRDEKAFNSKKINGARNFPKKSILQNLFKLRKDQAIFIYNNNNFKTKSLANRLVKKGYMPIYILDGGIENWTYQIKK